MEDAPLNILRKSHQAWQVKYSQKHQGIFQEVFCQNDFPKNEVQRNNHCHRTLPEDEKEVNLIEYASSPYFLLQSEVSQEYLPETVKTSHPVSGSLSDISLFPLSVCPFFLIVFQLFHAKLCHTCNNMFQITVPQYDSNGCQFCLNVLNLQKLHPHLNTYLYNN